MRREARRLVDIELIVGVREIVYGLCWPPQRVSDYAVGRIKNDFPKAFKVLRATALYDMGDVIAWGRDNLDKIPVHAPWRPLLVDEDPGVPDTLTERVSAPGDDPGADSEPVPSESDPAPVGA